MEIITSELEVLHAPPAPKRWKNIWKYELEHAITDHEDLHSPDYNEIKRQRKRKKVIKPKRKSKKQKKR